MNDEGGKISGDSSKVEENKDEQRTEVSDSNQVKLAFKQAEQTDTEVTSSSKSSEESVVAQLPEDLKESMERFESIRVALQSDEFKQELLREGAKAHPADDYEVPAEADLEDSPDDARAIAKKPAVEDGYGTTEASSQDACSSLKT